MTSDNRKHVFDMDSDEHTSDISSITSDDFCAECGHSIRYGCDLEEYCEDCCQPYCELCTYKNPSLIYNHPRLGCICYYCRQMRNIDTINRKLNKSS